MQPEVVYFYVFICYLRSWKRYFLGGSGSDSNFLSGSGSGIDHQNFLRKIFSKTYFGSNYHLKLFGKRLITTNKFNQFDIIQISIDFVTGSSSEAVFQNRKRKRFWWERMRMRKHFSNSEAEAEAPKSLPLSHPWL